MNPKTSELSEADRQWYLDQLTALGLQMKATRRRLGLDPDKDPCPYCGAKPAEPRLREVKRAPPSGKLAS